MEIFDFQYLAVYLQWKEAQKFQFSQAFALNYRLIPFNHKSENLRFPSSL